MQTWRIHSTVLIPLAIVIIVASGQTCAADSAPGGLPDYVPGEVLVTLKSSVTSAVRRTRSIAGVAAVEQVSRNLHRIRLQPDATVESMVERLKKEPMIAHVQPDYIKYMQTNDPDYGQQWGLHNTSQTGGTPGADISAEEAWAVTRGNRNVVVAVLDSGIARGVVTPYHPDLQNNLWRNTGETADDGIDNDGNGCIDDLIGCSFYDPDKPTGDPVDLDDSGHGTWVAGVIAAEADNEIGISGVSPEVSLMIVNIFNGGVTSTSRVVAGIDYAIAMGADVINASFGSLGPACCPGTSDTTGFDEEEYNAIKRAGDHGILVVAPAGNGGIDNDSFLNSPMVPASYNLDNIIAVAATDHNDRLAAFSNWGANSVDLGAPGVAIHTTTLGDSYQNVSGTSVAVGFVTGTVALMLSVAGDHTINGLKNRLLNSTDTLAVDQTGKIASGGRLNASAALFARADTSSQDRHRQYGTLNGGGGISMAFLLLVAATVFRVWNQAENS